MSRVTLSLAITVETELPEELLPALREQVERLLEALRQVEAGGADIRVILPPVEVAVPPGWLPPEGGTAPA
jgi:hypothetical protein